MWSALHVLLACVEVPDLVEDARPSDCAERVTSWADADGDGAGSPSRAAIGCNPPDGYVLNDDDCDDQDATVVDCTDSGEGT
jgi:hypothetical protein